MSQLPGLLVRYRSEQAVLSTECRRKCGQLQYLKNLVSDTHSACVGVTCCGDRHTVLPLCAHMLCSAHCVYSGKQCLLRIVFKQCHSLYARRLIQQATMFYKIHYNLVDICPPSYIQHANHISSRTDHPLKYCNKNPLQINAYKYSFFPRSMYIWNCLPCSVVSHVTPL